MRLALIARRFDPAGGGTERDLMVTARLLTRAGFEVRVYADEVRARASGFEVRSVGGPRLGRTAALVRFALVAPARARRDGADLVLSFGRVIGADVMRSGGGAHRAYLRAARLWRGTAGAAAMQLSPYHRAQALIERLGFRSRRLRRAIAVSDFVRDQLIGEFGLGAPQVVTIYNGVDLETFYPDADAGARGRARRALEGGAGGDAPLVAFVGNGFGRKGLEVLLRAIARLGGAPLLVVAGTDRAWARYQELARALSLERRVRFVGAHRDVPGLFRAADAFALPSFFEPFGNVVMEAMASGLPALTSSRSGVAEVVPALMRPFVVEDPSSPDEVAERLGALIQSRERLREAARAAAERFTWERYGEELLATLSALA